MRIGYAPGEPFFFRRFGQERQALFDLKKRECPRELGWRSDFGHRRSGPLVTVCY
jgi:hypothetical protein